MPFLTQGKTNWKYILIILVLAVIVGGGILGWIKQQEVPPPEFPEIKESKEVSKGEISEQREIEPLTPYETETKGVEYLNYVGKYVTGYDEELYYKHQGSNFEIEIIPVGESKYGIISYNSVLKIFDPNTGKYKLVSDLVGSPQIKVYGHENDLIIKGGSYARFGCCEIWHHGQVLIFNPFLDKKDSKEIDYSEIIGEPFLERSFSLFLNEEDELYLKANNGYYHSIPTKIPAFEFKTGADKYYLLEDGEVINQKKEKFKTLYVKTAKEYEEVLRKESWGHKEIFREGSSKTINDWFSPLLGKTVNLIFAGKEEAWDEFDKDFIELSQKYPLEINGETIGIDQQKIKQEIQKDLEGI